MSTNTSARYGTVQAQVKLYEEKGLAATSAISAGRWCSASATPRRGFVHPVMMAFENAADRESRRAALAADPEWRAYLAACREADYIVSRENHTLLGGFLFREVAKPANHCERRERPTRS